MTKAIPYLLALTGTLADYITTQIGLKYPELKEGIQYANPILEGVTSVAGAWGILKLAEKWKLPSKMGIFLASIPAAIPFTAALNNTILISIVHAKHYPFAECPLLYPEA